MKILQYSAIGLISFVVFSSCTSSVKEEATIIDDIEIQDSLVFKQLTSNVKEHPSVASNYELVANRYIEEKNYNEAIKILRIGIQKSDDALQLYDDLARAYLSKSEPENAREYINELKGSSQNPGNTFLQSVFEYETGNYTVAFDLINKALAFDNGNAIFYLYKSKILLAIKDTTSAISSLESSINCENAQIDNFDLLSDVLIKRGELSRAENVLQRAINKYPKNNRLQFNYAQFLEKTGKIDDAKQKYSDLKDTDLVLRANERLMDIYFTERKYDSLDMTIDQTLEKDSQNIPALLYSARVEDRFRRYQDAVDFYQRILSMDSTHAIASEELDDLQRKMRYLRRLRQREQEKEESQKIQPLNPI